MPWLIQHKCRPDQAEPENYMISRGERSGVPLTRVACVKKDCREEFFIMGHEMFQEAQSADEVARQGLLPGLPPGFVIPRSTRRT